MKQGVMIFWENLFYIDSIHSSSSFLKQIDFSSTIQFNFILFIFKFYHFYIFIVGIFAMTLTLF